MNCRIVRAESAVNANLAELRMIFSAGACPPFLISGMDGKLISAVLIRLHPIMFTSCVELQNELQEKFSFLPKRKSRFYSK